MNLHTNNNIWNIHENIMITYRNRSCKRPGGVYLAGVPKGEGRLQVQGADFYILANAPPSHVYHTSCIKLSMLVYVKEGACSDSTSKGTPVRLHNHGRLLERLRYVLVHVTWKYMHVCMIT